MAVIDQYLIEMLDRGGSDLHLMIGQPIKARVQGALEDLTDEPVTPDFMLEMLKEVTPPKRWEHFRKHNDLDFAHEIPEVARFRTNLLRNYWGIGAVLRQIPTKILTIDDLKLPPVLTEICDMKSGLSLVTGPTGSGKSTTLAAMIDYINDKYHKHIITIEDPIEFVHTNNKCLINQREVGIDVVDFGVGMKHAVREDPDIILVGELRDEETFMTAIHAAETGHLVFGTIHASTSPSTIGRILDLFPEEMHNAIRSAIAMNMKAIIAQKLLRPICKNAIDEQQLFTFKFKKNKDE